MELRVAIIGFGNVGRAFARLLQRKRTELSERYGIECAVTAIATARHGAVISKTGLDLDAAGVRIGSGLALEGLADSESVPGAAEAIERCTADVLFETTPLNPYDGEPAITHIHRALLRGISVVTANKGPVAYAYRRLSQLAANRDAMFRFEGTVMDGCQVFNLAELCI